MSRSYPRVITLTLVFLNCLAILYAILEGDPGQRDYHFREGFFITWLGSAQMVGASLLFVACHLAGQVIDEGEQQQSKGWLVLAFGFLLLALDQQFRIREQITLLIDGYPAGQGAPTSTHAVLKITAIVTAIGLVAYYRATVLANFRMVLAFIAGFWFLILMLVFDMLFESIGVPSAVVKIMEGSAKLLAMAMFLNASYTALLDRLSSARVASKHQWRRQIFDETSGRRPAEVIMRQELRHTLVETPTGKDPATLLDREARVTMAGTPRSKEEIRSRRSMQTIPDTPSSKMAPVQQEEEGDAPRPARSGTEESTSGEPKSGEPKSGESKSDEPKSDEPKSDKSKPDKSKPDKSKPDKSKPDKSKPDKSKPDKPKPDKSKPDSAES